MKIKKTILALLFASLYVCANTEQPVFLLVRKNNDADASFCFDLRRGLERPVLLLVKKNNNLEIRSTLGPKPIKCEFYGQFLTTEINLIDETGKNIISFHGLYDYYGIPTGIPIHLPLDMRSVFNESSEEVVLENLLQFTGKVIDGYITVSSTCKPDLDTIYKFVFHAKIIGQCEPDFLSDFGREVE
jgi:hypothetical protein